MTVATLGKLGTAPQPLVSGIKLGELRLQVSHLGTEIGDGLTEHPLPSARPPVLVRPCRVAILDHGHRVQQAARSRALRGAS